MSKVGKKEIQHIHAYARLRPFNKLEAECHATNILDINGRDITLKMLHGSKKYTFDKVFDVRSKQKDVYMTIVSPMIEEVMLGYNCTVFAYGQTGSGKTYTMVGNPTTSSISYNMESEAGIIPRTLGHLFQKLGQNDEVDFTIRVSYLELYNEVLIDLLSPDEKVLKIYEDPKNKGAIQVHGLEEITVYDKNEVFKILQRGSEKRITAATLMNAQSSRSHTVFTVTLHSRETTPDGEELVKTGKLNLVDLAGSENIQRSGAIDKRAREAGNINQSLLTLGRVIKSLVEKQGHVPYRESKLTRILQDSLGGRTKTTIIATVSAASNNLEETMSTLDYAFRARNIYTRPEVNQRTSKTALIQCYLEDIDRLKRDLLAARTQQGVYLDTDNYNNLVEESVQIKNKLMKSIEECSAFEGRAQELERVREELEQINVVTKTELDDATLSLGKSRDYLKQLRKERRVHQELIDKFDAAQTGLRTHVSTLEEALDARVKESVRLQDKVVSFYEATEQNTSSSRAFLNSFTKKQSAVTNQAKNMIENEFEKHFDEIDGCLKQYYTDSKASANVLTDNIIDMRMKVEMYIDKINEQSKNQLNTVLQEIVRRKVIDNDAAMEIQKQFESLHSASKNTTLHMKNDMAKFKDEITKHSNIINSRIQKIQQTVQQDSLDVMVLSNKIKDDQLNQLDKAFQTIKVLSEKQELAESSLCISKQSINRYIDDFEKCMQQKIAFMKSEVGRNLHITQQKFMPVTDGINSLEGEAGTLADMIIIRNAELEDNRKLQVNSVKQNIEELLAKNNEFVECAEDQNKAMLDAVSQVDDDMLDKYSALFAKTSRSYRKDQIATYEQREQNAAENRATINKYLQDFASMNQECIEKKEHGLNQFKQDMNRNELLIGELMQNLSTTLHEQVENITDELVLIEDMTTKFISQDLVSVVPGGDTPMKKPSPLIATLPQKVSTNVLQKYQHLDANMSILTEEDSQNYSTVDISDSEAEHNSSGDHLVIAFNLDTTQEDNDDED